MLILEIEFFGDPKSSFFEISLTFSKFNFWLILEFLLIDLALFWNDILGEDCCEMTLSKCSSSFWFVFVFFEKKLSKYFFAFSLLKNSYLPKICLPVIKPRLFLISSLIYEFELIKEGDIDCLWTFIFFSKIFNFKELNFLLFLKKLLYEDSLFPPGVFKRITLLEIRSPELGVGD